MEPVHLEKPAVFVEAEHRLVGMQYPLRHPVEILPYPQHHPEGKAPLRVLRDQLIGFLVDCMIALEEYHVEEMVDPAKKTKGVFSCSILIHIVTIFDKYWDNTYKY